MNASPFKTRTVLILIAIGLAAMLGFLLVAGYGGQLERQRGNTPSPVSRYATGFQALSTLIELSGGSVTLTGDVDRRGDGLLILTPNMQTTADELATALGDGETPALIVLPKWIATPQPLRPAREEKFGTIPPKPIVDMLAKVTRLTVERGPGGTTRNLSGLPFQPAHVADTSQTVSGPDLVPLIAALGDKAILAEVKGANRYILADPDLLNNLGLADRRNARAAIAMLAALDPDHPGTITFDTMLPFGAGGRNLVQLIFEPPFAGVTIALFAAALLAGLATLIRFGPVRREPRALAFGKRALIENIVGLARRAGRIREGGPAYADTIRDWAARHLALPRTLQGEALDAHLDRLKTTIPYAEWAARLRTSKTEADMLEAARKLDDWRKEVKA